MNVANNIVERRIRFFFVFFEKLKYPINDTNGIRQSLELGFAHHKSGNLEHLYFFAQILVITHRKMVVFLKGNLVLFDLIEQAVNDKFLGMEFELFYPISARFAEALGSNQVFYFIKFELFVTSFGASIIRQVFVQTISIAMLYLLTWRLKSPVQCFPSKIIYSQLNCHVTNE